jgi:hypothetical protein
MKKLITIALLILAANVNVFAQNKTKVYWEVISNDSKTIDYTIGVYPGSYAYFQPDGIDPYATLTMRVINKGSETLKWNEHSRVFILLKNGTLMCNYLTAATDGDKVCSYSVFKDETHEQTLCYGEKFDVADIDKMWIYDAPHDQIFSLVYDELDSK